MEHTPPQFMVYGVMVLLGFVVIPVWLGMGLADYICHRKTDIENTSGTRESALHLVQFGLTGVPLTAALFFQVNAGLLLAMAVFIVLHHAVAYIDVRYANATRQVLPIEQMIHSFLELLPIVAFLLVATLEFGQLQALFGYGAQHADFAPRLRQPPLPGWYIASVLFAALLANFGPYAEELIRCLRAGRTVTAKLKL